MCTSDEGGLGREISGHSDHRMNAGFPVGESIGATVTHKRESHELSWTSY